MRAVGLAVALLLALAAPAAAQHDHHGPPRPDSDAPAGAPPHWLPTEPWVLNHWLPYDEPRLLALLGITRDALWRHLRDDRRTLAALAARRGWRRPHALARALVAPRRARGARRRLLEDRAHRTLTQGHLAQHILFHTLHQEVLPQLAQRIFGVPTPRFRALRRMDLAPLEIARFAGRTRAQVEREATAALRRAARSGVRRGETSRRQAALLLDRQLHQLPRWLEHPRYNGPPPTDDAGRLEEPLRAHALRPALAPDGSWVAFEQAQPSVGRAVREGEIAVQARRLDGAPVLGAPATLARGAPCSAYGAAAAGAGSVVFELLAGNGTFGKRYGEPQVARADLATGAVTVLSPRRWTAYRPSAGGDAVAFQAVRPGGPPSQVAVWRAGRVSVLRGARREPALSGDGRVLATVVRGGVAVRAGGRERVIAARDAAEPVLDGAGRTLAFTAAGPRVVVVDLATGRRRALPRGTHQPALAPDGTALAYAQRAGGAATPAGRPAQRLLVEPPAGGVPAVIAAGGYNAHPSLAAGGRRVAFTNEGADRTQRVLVHDRATGATRQVSAEPGLTAALRAPCRPAAPAW